MKKILNSRKIQEKKETAQFLREISNAAKSDHCLLCGKKNVPICNSHIVPQFILKKIADDGMICYGQSLYKESESMFETKKGVKTAFTFHLICRDCDKNRFKNYENPNAILNFETLNNNLKNQILKEMALKTHLAHIYSKRKSLKLREKVYQEELNEIHNFGLSTAFEIDIDEHLQYIKNLSKKQKTTSFTFNILYNQLLDYEVGIATQTIIAFQYDLYGNQLFNPNDYSTTNFVKYFYLMILPYEGKTRIIFYIEKKHKSLCQSLIDQFNTLTSEEKLHFLFISLMIHDEQFYINPTLQEQIRKDKKLVRLYTYTDPCIDTDYFIEIKNFRKYNNYLLPTNQKK